MTERERQKEIVAKFNMMDDTFFHKMAEDVAVCEEMLQTILRNPKLKVVKSAPQKFLRNTGARSVILDVLCKDEKNRLMNIEVQKENKDNHQKRVRYNGSNIDTYYTEKGVAYNKIPDVYVIFISKFDIFKENQPIYHIDRVVRETGKVVYNGFHEIYVNTKVNDGSKVARLMQLMLHTKSDNREFPNIAGRARYLKEEQKGVQIMCEELEKYANERAAKAAREAKKEAKKEAKEAARTFFRNGVSYELVRESMKNLTEKELNKIYQEVEKSN